eukprot:5123695-Pyramimonas_sp.AAC.1
MVCHVIVVAIVAGPISNVWPLLLLLNSFLVCFLSSGPSSAEPLTQGTRLQVKKRPASVT